MEIEKKKKDSQHQRDECEWRHESGDDGVFPLLHQMKLLFEQKERKKKDWDKYRLKRAKVFFFWIGHPQIIRLISDDYRNKTTWKKPKKPRKMIMNK